MSPSAEAGMPRVAVRKLGKVLNGGLVAGVGEEAG
jgi:hypothetical protein